MSIMRNTDDNFRLIVEYRDTNNEQMLLELINKNQNMIHKYAKEYIGVCKSLEYEDLYYEGVSGFIKAVNTYDEKKDVKFSTYAMYCVKYEILNAINNTDLIIRLPISVTQNMNKINKHSYLANITSLDSQLKEDEPDDYYEVVASSVDIVADLETNIVKNEIFNAINGLSYKEKTVVLARFGFLDRVYTLEEVSKLINVSNEGVRVIEKRALKRLKDTDFIKSLKKCGYSDLKF